MSHKSFICDKIKKKDTASAVRTRDNKVGACNGHLEVVKYLFQQVAEINSADRGGYTALMLSAVEGHRLIVKTLIDHTANVNAQECDDFTALHLASENNRTKCLRVLL